MGNFGKCWFYHDILPELWVSWFGSTDCALKWLSECDLLSTFGNFGEWCKIISPERFTVHRDNGQDNFRIREEAKRRSCRRFWVRMRSYCNTTMTIARSLIDKPALTVFKNKDELIIESAKITKWIPWFHHRRKKMDVPYFWIEYLTQWYGSGSQSLYLDIVSMSHRRENSNISCTRMEEEVEILLRILSPAKKGKMRWYRPRFSRLHWSRCLMACGFSSYSGLTEWSCGYWSKPSWVFFSDTHEMMGVW